MSVDPVEECDRLTRRRLLAAAGGHARPGTFRSRWWDGACHVPCLVVRTGGRRLRVVETHGGVLLLPGATGRARRVLHAWRRTPMGPPLAAAWTTLQRVDPRTAATAAPASTDVTVVARPVTTVRLRWQPVRVPLPAQRVAHEIAHISHNVDVTSCRVADCGGLRVLPAPGETEAAASCPCCGVAA